jgi:hypothetical protein
MVSGSGSGVGVSGLHDKNALAMSKAEIENTENFIRLKLIMTMYITNKYTKSLIAYFVGLRNMVKFSVLCYNAIVLFYLLLIASIFLNLLKI